MVLTGAEVKPSSSAASSHLPPAHWTSEVTRFLVQANSNDTHALRTRDLCLLWLFVVSLLWPKMREQCGDGLCSSLVRQGHKAGPKARDDPAEHLFFFTSQTTLRTAKPWPEQSLLKPNPLQWCVLDTNGGRQRRHLCLTKYIFRQQLHKKIFTKQEWAGKKKQLRTILDALHSRFHWMPSPVCGPWGLWLAKWSAHINQLSSAMWFLCWDCPGNKSEDGELLSPNEPDFSAY